MKKNETIAILPLIAAVLSLAGGVGCIIYGAMYDQYADWAIVLALILGALLLGFTACFRSRAGYWTALLGTLFSAAGLSLFIANSYNVWADMNGNLSQYGSLTGDFNFFGSEGGPIPAIILIALALIASVAGIAACFTKNVKEAN